MKADNRDNREMQINILLICIFVVLFGLQYENNSQNAAPVDNHVSSALLQEANCSTAIAAVAPLVPEDLFIQTNPFSLTGSNQSFSETCISGRVAVYLSDEDVKYLDCKPSGSYLLLALIRSRDRDPAHSIS